MAYEVKMDGMVAIVTGGARGIGSACTKLFTEAGAQCVISGTSPEERYKPYLDELEATYGIRPVYVQSDISVEEDVVNLVKFTAEKFGRIDIVVANAGGGTNDFDETLRRNVYGTYWLMREAEPLLAKAPNGGRVVFIGSTTTLYGGHPKDDSEFLLYYIAAKGGEEALTRYYARRFLPEHIRVNCVLPGAIVTESLNAPFGSYEKSWEHYSKLIPLGRPGTPEDLAGAVFFLCSDMASYVTAYTYILDGGRHVLGY